MRCSTSNCHVVMNAIIVQSCSLLSPLSAISASLHITRYWQSWLRNEGHYLSTLSTESQLIWWLQYLLPKSLCHYAMHILCPYLVCSSLQWCLRPAIYSHSWSVVTALPPPPPLSLGCVHCTVRGRLQPRTGPRECYGRAFQSFLSAQKTVDSMHVIIG